MHKTLYTWLNKNLLNKTKVYNKTHLKYSLLPQNDNKFSGISDNTDWIETDKDETFIEETDKYVRFVLQYRCL